MMQNSKPKMFYVFTGLLYSSLRLIDDSWIQFTFFCFLNVSQAHALCVLASSWQCLGRFLEISENILIMNKEGHGIEA